MRLPDDALGSAGRSSSLDAKMMMVMCFPRISRPLPSLHQRTQPHHFFLGWHHVPQGKCLRCREIVERS
jgi:hypothetical protein